MVKVTFLPDKKYIEVDEGTKISDALSKAKINIDMPCGGEGTCGKCKVLIARGAPSAGFIEKKFLTEKEIAKGYRLACQAKLIQDTIIEIPPELRLNLQEYFLPQAKGDVYNIGKCFQLDTDLRKIFIELEEPSIEDQRSDWERIKDALYQKKIKNTTISSNLLISLEVLRKIPKLIREADFKITVTIIKNEVIEIEKGDSSDHSYGIAFDIGTTTVAGYLINLISGKEITAVAKSNPQIKHGDDVISRIGFVQKYKDGLQGLQEEIVTAINEIITEITRKAKINKKHIYRIVFVGNTCMHHLLLGINPINLAPSPYIPVIRDSLNLKAMNIPGLFLNQTTDIFLLPNISAFVGADISAGIIANNLWEKDKTTLLVDLGTNGEIVLGLKGKLWACSTAVGPAFEGARISSGMRAAKGAIDKVKIENDSISYRVIENGNVKGLCGAGLIDVIAELLRLGLINRSGKLLGREECANKVSKEIKKRILEVKNGNKFLLIEGEKTVSGEAIYLTQKDIREVQLAKAAVNAGIKILLKEVNISVNDIDEILLAGAFGNFIDRKNAVRVGLIPDLSLKKIKAVGNSAGRGAELVLCSNKKMQLAEEISKKVNYIELSSNSNFQKEFIEEIFFNKS
jgi:uncharacterized 2Fe-2S/4Fe-4S cluster protein (DUF4445 family)